MKNDKLLKEELELEKPSLACVLEQRDSGGQDGESPIVSQGGLKEDWEKWVVDLMGKISAAKGGEEETVNATEEQEAALCQRIQDVEQRERRQKAMTLLSGFGMPEELAACVDLDSEVDLEISVAALKTAFFDAVYQEVNKRMAADSPKTCDLKSADPFLRGLGNERI